MVGPLHVDYVTENPTEIVRAAEYVAETLSDPANAALFLVGCVAAAVAVFVGSRIRGTVPDFAVLGATLDGYRNLVPWMLRLAIGLPTLGAGFAGYYFSPLVEAPAFRIPLIAVGFLLLTGTATRVVALTGLALWTGGVVVRPELLLTLEYPFAFAGIALVGPGRPSGDHLLGRLAADPDTYYRRIDPVHAAASGVASRLRNYEALLPVILRAGMGLSFVYLGIVEKVLDPGRAAQVVAKYDLTAVVPVDPGVWVLGAAATEVGVGVLLLAGLLTRGTAAVAFVVLTTTLFGLPDDPVLAHVSLFGLTSAIFTLGAGPYSLDRWLDRREAGDDTTTDATPAD